MVKFCICVQNNQEYPNVKIGRFVKKIHTWQSFMDVIKDFTQLYNRVSKLIHRG